MSCYSYSVGGVTRCVSDADSLMALFVQDQIALGHTVYSGSYETNPSGSTIQTTINLWYVDLPSTLPVSISLTRNFLGPVGSSTLLSHGPAISGLSAPSLIPFTTPAPSYSQSSLQLADTAIAAPQSDSLLMIGKGYAYFGALLVAIVVMGFFWAILRKPAK